MNGCLCTAVPGRTGRPAGGARICRDYWEREDRFSCLLMREGRGVLELSSFIQQDLYVGSRAVSQSIRISSKGASDGFDSPSISARILRISIVTASFRPARPARPDVDSGVLKRTSGSRAVVPLY